MPASPMPGPTSPSARSAIGNRLVAVTEEVVPATPFASLLHFRKDVDIAQPRVLVVAPMSGHFATLLRNTVQVAAAGPRRLHHRLAQRARRAARRRAASGSTSIIDHIIAVPAGDRPRRACAGGLPALRRGARRGGADGGGPRSLLAAQHDADGRADRHPRQPDQGERAGQVEADRVVREEPDRHGALAAQGRRPPGLSRLRAAHRLHGDEHGAPRQGAPRPVLRHLADGDAAKAERCTGASTTSISPCMDLPAEFYLETVRTRVPGRTPAAGQADLPRPQGAPGGDPPHRAADGGGRAGRHLRHRPDHGGARPLPRRAGAD